MSSTRTTNKQMRTYLIIIGVATKGLSYRQIAQEFQKYWRFNVRAHQVMNEPNRASEIMA